MFSHELTRIDYDNCWIEPSLSISDVTNGNCAVYPNPCTDIITIKLISKEDVKLYDIIGREIESQYGDLVSFEMSEKKQGVYYITTTLSGKKITKIIVKK